MPAIESMANIITVCLGNFSTNNIEGNKKMAQKDQTMQEGMKSFKNNGSNVSSLDDKFKDIENLRNNPNKDFSTNNIEGNKIKGIRGTDCTRRNEVI